MQTLVLCLMVAVCLSTLLKLSLATPRVRWITLRLVRPLRWARMAVGGGAIQNAD